MDDQSYHSAMVQVRNEFHAHVSICGLVLANKVLPGIDDAARRFREHKADKGYQLNGHKNLTAYINSLGYKPATVRKWRQRLRDLEEKVLLLTSNPSAENICDDENQNKPKENTQAQIVKLAVKGSSIICNQLGTRLKETAEGKEVVQIASEILELNRK
jgi:hypothetical protein